MADIPQTFKVLEESLFEQSALFLSESSIKASTEEGDPLRTLFEAVALEVENLSFRFDETAKALIPIGAFEAFDFSLAGPQKSSTTIRFTRANPVAQVLIIPEGTIVARADGVEYVTTTEDAIPSLAVTIDIPAVSVESGAHTNTNSNTILFIRNAIPTVIGVTNIIPATGGQDEETISQAKVRFTKHVNSFHRGTKEAISAGLLTAETIAGERPQNILVLDHVDDNTISLGRMTILVDDGTATASVDLINAVIALVPDYIAAGSAATVEAVLPRPVNIFYKLKGNSEDLPACDIAALDYIANLKIGEKVSRENLITALSNAAKEPREITLDIPAEDVLVDFKQRAVIDILEGSMEV